MKKLVAALALACMAYASPALAENAPTEAEQAAESLVLVVQSLDELHFENSLVIEKFEKLTNKQLDELGRQKGFVRLLLNTIVKNHSFTSTFKTWTDWQAKQQ